MIPLHGWTPRDPRSVTASQDECERCHDWRMVSMDGLCLVCHSAREDRRVAARKGLDRLAGV